MPLVPLPEMDTLPVAPLLALARVAATLRAARRLLVTCCAAAAVGLAGPAAALALPAPGGEGPLPRCERPNPPKSCSADSPTGQLDSVSRTVAGLVVTGRATEPDHFAPVTVDVHVDHRYAGSLVASGAGGAFSGIVPPVAGREVCLLARNRGMGEDTWLGCRALTVRVDPVGQLDEVAVVDGGLRVRGWGIDADTTSPITVHVYVDGRFRQEIDASGDRPDVAAAHPGYGVRHGFDVTLPGPTRHSSVCAYGINTGPGSVNTLLGCRRSRSAFSVLTANLQGLDTTFGPWRDRWARVAGWMADQGTLPDVIALQEVPARKRWFPDSIDPADYEALTLLVRRIKERTGADYRIAYLDAPYVPQGVNALFQGRAMLYNINRVRNTTTLVNAWAVPHDLEVDGVHMRRSFPCDRPSPALPETCSLLDGTGPHWASGFESADDGRWTSGPQAAMFELVDDPGRHVLVANVHWDRSAPGYRAAIDDLVAATWSMWRSRPKLLPPIVVGDFNGGFELADFEGTANVDVDWVITGTPSAFDGVSSPPVEMDIAPHPRNKGDVPSSCGDTSTLWADHCGLFVQYLPRG